MTDPLFDRSDPDSARLLRRWRAAAPPLPAPDAMELAAYAEGRLDPARAEAVEGWLARDPEMLAVVLACRPSGAADSVAADAEPAVLDVVRRARGLVAPSGTPRPWQRAAGWSGAVAAMLVACILSFQAGQELGVLGDSPDAQGSELELFIPSGDADALL